ncbi:MarR family winged helix-turn-helix transcriptional regulator [Corynebacterium bovis]|nr:MarR family winged helix-turn-helix transcriptional regulator [Corynebacterium bovis]MDK8510917.1 MarR family winged helix-turn-helix transcriptional regulator [Corynebacterium bovis]
MTDDERTGGGATMADATTNGADTGDAADRETAATAPGRPPAGTGTAEATAAAAVADGAAHDPAVLDLAATARATVRDTVIMMRLLDRGSDLPLTQVNILNWLLDTPRGMGTLCTLAGVSQPGMSQHISKLVDAGLVRRLPHPEDARAVLVDLTDAGRETVTETNRQRDELLAGLLGGISAGERERLREALPVLHTLARRVIGR